MREELRVHLQATTDRSPDFLRWPISNVFEHRVRADRASWHVQFTSERRAQARENSLHQRLAVGSCAQSLAQVVHKLARRVEKGHVRIGYRDVEGVLNRDHVFDEVQTHRPKA